MKIYLATSWKNTFHATALHILREAGHDVYDFKNPEPGNTGFGWTQCTPPGESIHDPIVYREILRHPITVEGFRFDMTALNWCEACVLLAPCGNDAHLELGYATGRGKLTIVILDNPASAPGLMYRMCTHVVLHIEEAITRLREVQKGCHDAASYFDFAAQDTVK